MCFSFKVSLFSFLLCWIISFYLLSKNITKKQKQNIIFLIIFSSIQLADAILWFINMKKNNINYYVTSYLIPFILSLQIIYNIYFINNINNLIINFVVICLIIYMFYRFNGYSISLCNNKLSSPIWGSNEIKFWEFLVFSILILYPNVTNIALTMGVLYPILYLYVGGAYGSLWCAIATLLSNRNLSRII